MARLERRPFLRCKCGPEAGKLAAARSHEVTSASKGLGSGPANAGRHPRVFRGAHPTYKPRREIRLQEPSNPAHRRALGPCNMVQAGFTPARGNTGQERASDL